MSKDPTLNDIPLSLWDARHYIINSRASRAGLGYNWSLSDSVCCLKAFAIRLIKREQMKYINEDNALLIKSWCDNPEDDNEI